MELEDLRKLEAEFKATAKRLVEIHNEVKQNVCTDVPVQKRYFFYSALVEIEMSKDFLESENMTPELVVSSAIKDMIDVAIVDETPLSLTEYGGYCSEVVG